MTAELTTLHDAYFLERVLKVLILREPASVDISTEYAALTGGILEPDLPPGIDMADGLARRRGTVPS